MPRRLLAALFAVMTAMCIVALGNSDVRAQSNLQGGIIEEIRIEGSQRIDPETIRANLPIEPGDPFNALTLDRALKSLFDTGFFADVTLRRQGSTLIITVEENPSVSRIAFEGNKRIEDETLSAEIELKPSRVYTRTKAQNDRQRILDLYRRQGRFAATVEPKIIELDQNRVDVVFEIDEGPLTTIRAINFVGNRAFSDSDLRDELLSQEYSFWNVLATTDSYDPDRLSFDEQLLRQYYLSEGYADFRVVSTVAELTPDREGFIITFTVEEGPVYEFGEIDVETTLPQLDTEQLEDLLLTETGETYDAELVEETVQNLTDAVGNLGFAFVQIQPRVDRDRENLIINLSYEINEGPKVFVERIDIVGNVRTQDNVIRREMRLIEGDAFNAAKIRRSEQRIRNLGFFQSVEVAREEGSSPDRSVVTVEVEEQSTGEFTFGAGFSSDAGPLASAGVVERNLLGRGQNLQVNFSIAAEQSQIDASFTEPYFLDRDLSAGVDVFRTISSQLETSFTSERIGAGVRSGYDLSRNIRQRWGYRLQLQEIRDVSDTASAGVKAEEGSKIVSSVQHVLTYDTLDDRFDPSSGFQVRGTTEIAGLGGEVRFISNRVSANVYNEIFDEWVLRLGTKFGNITGLGQDTRITDRFFIGSSQFRGFESAGVGPRDSSNNDALGGENYAVGTVEVTFPLGLPDELGIKGRAFTDIGTVWGVPDSLDSVALDSTALRATAGVGMSWDSPLGPFVLDFGIPFIKEDFDQREVLFFSLGTRF